MLSGPSGVGGCTGRSNGHRRWRKGVQFLIYLTNPFVSLKKRRIRIIIIIRKNYNKAGEINQGLLCIELITKVTKGGRGAVKIPHENIYTYGIH